MTGQILAACLAMATLLGRPGLALDLVRQGRPMATIVIPAQPLPVESYAAEELRYHIRAATGADLNIVSEDKKIPPGVQVYLGHCKAAAEAEISPSALPGNGYRIQTIGKRLFIVGKDTAGDPLDRDTHVGTLFGVYDLLETNLGVRWLWPGKLGEVIPHRKNLPLPALNTSVKPLLWFKEWRGGLPGGRIAAADPRDRSFLLEQARWLRPDVKVVSYVYDNYRKPPVKPIQLSENVVCGFVPWAPFPYSKQTSDLFQREWKGWADTGCVLFLRPNYTLYGHNYPLFYARNLGDDLKFAMAHGMRGTDFDSLTGQYSTQGPTLYMLATVLNHPKASVEGVLHEYCAAFGSARQTILEYFNHWEAVNQRFSSDEIEKRRRVKRKYGPELEIIMGPEIFTPDAMRAGWALLERARKQVAREPVALARVEWLVNGLKQVELVLAAERAYEHGVDTGDRREFLQAYKALSDFRMEHGDEMLSNIGYLAEDEHRLWKVE